VEAHARALELIPPPNVSQPPIAEPPVVWEVCIIIRISGWNPTPVVALLPVPFGAVRNPTKALMPFGLLAVGEKCGNGNVTASPAN
jgi:hypothetical protein